MSLPVTIENKSKSPPRHLRVLYADDVGELRQLLQNLLERDGHSIECVADGKQALEKITGNPRAFDLVITDHHMPIMDGLQLVQGLRDLGFPGHILVFSSELSLEIAAKYEALKVDGVLPKPVYPSVLRELIGRF
jgi:two-component system, chemotaxis family, chemotaxis protein CheY